MFGREAEKYQFYSLWFDQTGLRTHDLPYSWQALSLTITPVYYKILFERTIYTFVNMCI